MSHWNYEVRSVHPIAPRHTDVTVASFWQELEPMIADHKALGAALRGEGVLLPRQRVRECRLDVATGNLVVFPSHVVGGPHALVFRPIREDDTYACYVTTTDGIGTDAGFCGRCHSTGLYSFISALLRPLCSQSAPRTYELHVGGRLAGGFFTDAGSDAR